MLCADRRIKPREVKVITGYPRTEILMGKIRQAGFENSQYSVLNHSDHTRVELQKAFKDDKVRVIFADECVIPGDVTLEEGSQQDWRWLDSISNSSTDLVLCLKPSPAAEEVKLPMATRVTTRFLPTPHRQGLQPNCMWRYYSRVKGLDNHMDVKKRTWTFVQDSLKMEREDRLPESEPTLWMKVKERGWDAERILQELRGVRVRLAGKETGLFLCGSKELARAKSQMPLNWTALHQDSMHGLEAEVLVLNWLSSSILFVVRRSPRIRDTSSHLHYMMFQTIQTIYILCGYDPGNMSVSSYPHMMTIKSS